MWRAVVHTTLPVLQLTVRAEERIHDLFDVTLTRRTRHPLGVYVHMPQGVGERKLYRVPVLQRILLLPGKLWGRPKCGMDH
jgi:hypothetical protein